jgi:hypothetical protein
MEKKWKTISDTLGKSVKSPPPRRFPNDITQELTEAIVG